MTALPTFANQGQLTGAPGDAIEWASVRIRNYCGWHIYPAVSEILTFDTVPATIIGLPSLKVTAVTSVTVRGELLDPSEYEWSTQGMLRRLNYCVWPEGFQAVAVALTHGYSDIPGDLAQVCASLAARMPAQMAAVTAESAAQVSRTYGGQLSGGFAPTGWTTAEQQTLDTYRIRPLP